MFPQAVELRAKCSCPALPDPDPRVVFSMTAKMLLEKAEKEKNYAKELKERERAAETSQQRVQTPLLSAQHHALLSKEDQITPLHTQVSTEMTAK